MSHTNFTRTRCTAAHFDQADLSHSIFWNVNAKGAYFDRADLTNVNFSRSNLHETDFNNTKVTDSQLFSALSIRDARLPNGTLARDPNLINNGQADCNISLVKNWKLQTGKVTTEISDDNTSNCHFVLQSYDNGATMSQRISLLNIWDSNIWPYPRAVLSARVGIDVSIQLSGISSIGKTRAQYKISKFKHNSKHFGAFFCL
jgi:uncharacterized protein YjbI with pentapeptide repeats